MGAEFWKMTEFGCDTNKQIHTAVALFTKFLPLMVLDRQPSRHLYIFMDVLDKLRTKIHQVKTFESIHLQLNLSQVVEYNYVWDSDGGRANALVLIIFYKSSHYSVYEKKSYKKYMDVLGARWK